MPSKTVDPNKPTFYLDNSTLCAGIKAHRLLKGNAEAFAPYRPIVPWVERVAREANFCLSLTHITELARWDGDPETADAMARWYDELPVVWTHGRDAIAGSEDSHWVAIAGGAPPPEVRVFAPSLLSAFQDIGQPAAAYALASPCPVLALLQASRERRPPRR